MVALNPEAQRHRADALARKGGTGADKARRIALAKRRAELELRAAGLSRTAAKVAVAVRFSRS